MPIYRYSSAIEVADTDDVILSASFPDPGTASHNIIDTQINNDFEELNDFSVSLGKGADAKKERTLIFTNAVNMDENNLNIKINYFVNGKIIVTHSNLKSLDNNPQIKINLTFQ
jgi:hypothetical protein